MKHSFRHFSFKKWNRWNLIGISVLKRHVQNLVYWYNLITSTHICSIVFCKSSFRVSTRLAETFLTFEKADSMIRSVTQNVFACFQSSTPWLEYSASAVVQGGSMVKKMSYRVCRMTYLISYTFLQVISDLFTERNLRPMGGRELIFPLEPKTQW